MWTFNQCKRTCLCFNQLTGLSHGSPIFMYKAPYTIQWLSNGYQSQYSLFMKILKRDNTLTDLMPCHCPASCHLNRQLAGILNTVDVMMSYWASYFLYFSLPFCSTATTSHYKPHLLSQFPHLFWTIALITLILSEEILTGTIFAQICSSNWNAV